MKKKRLRKSAYPSKTTLNLAMKEKGEFHLSRLIPLLLIIFILVVAFAKFAVADRLSAIYLLEAEAASLRLQQEALAIETEAYGEVLDEYSRYSIDWMDSKEVSLIDRTEILKLAEEELMPRSELRSIAVSDNTVSVQLAGLTLSEASKLVESLSLRKGVRSVNIYSATTRNEAGLSASISMVIVMGQDEREATR